MEKGNRKSVYIAAISYAFITGLSFLFTKKALEVGGPLDILSYRFTASFLVVLITVIFGWAKVDYNKEKVKKILPIALLYPLSFFAFQTFGLQNATSSEAGILLAASPVFTMVLAEYFLKEKSSMMQKASIILSVSGVIYISIMKGSNLDINNMKGIILLLLSALSFSGYSIMARGVREEFTSIELSYMMITISFICFNILSIGEGLIAGNLGSYFLPLKSPQFIISILYLGILSTLLTSTLTNYVLSKIEASKMSVFSNLGTVISIVAGVVFLKEEIFYYHIIGSVLIILGVLGANFLGKKDDEKEIID